VASHISAGFGKAMAMAWPNPLRRRYQRHFVIEFELVEDQTHPVVQPAGANRGTSK